MPGIAIVLLAIVLDRLTEHASERLDPRHRAGSTAGRIDRRVVSVVGGGRHRRLVVGGLVLPAARSSPTIVQVSFREPVNAVVDWMRLARRRD